MQIVPMRACSYFCEQLWLIGHSHSSQGQRDWIPVTNTWNYWWIGHSLSTAHVQELPWTYRTTSFPGEVTSLIILPISYSTFKIWRQLIKVDPPKIHSGPRLMDIFKGPPIWKVVIVVLLWVAFVHGNFSPLAHGLLMQTKTSIFISFRVCSSWSRKSLTVREEESAFTQNNYFLVSFRIIIDLIH